MKAVTYEQFGGLNVLHVADAAVPTPRKGEVIVAVRATSVNVIDGRVRSGMMGPLVSKSFPKIPGADFAGIVSAIGAGVSGFKVGDAVFGAVNPFAGGAFAEYVRTPAKQIALKPAGLSFEEAAALPIAGLAALQSLRDIGKVHDGARVLIHGASGGVGLFAVQLSKRLGAHVTAVAGPDAAKLLKALGADVVINHAERTVAPADGPFDFILDASGKASWAEAHDLLTAHGVLAELSPTIPGFIGSKLANLTRRQSHAMVAATPNTRDLAELAALALDGQLKITIAQSYGFGDAITALADQEGGHTIGKRVVILH